jgi:hypothetical protein
MFGTGSECVVSGAGTAISTAEAVESPFDCEGFSEIDVGESIALGAGSAVGGISEIGETWGCAGGELAARPSFTATGSLGGFSLTGGLAV